MPSWFMYGMLHDYFDNLKTLYNIEYTNDQNMIYTYNPTKVTFVYEIDISSLLSATQVPQALIPPNKVEL